MAENIDMEQKEQVIIKCIDNSGRTILHLAYRNGKCEMCLNISLKCIHLS